MNKIREKAQGRTKQIVGQMIAISQRDLPYLVLTVDPVLQAYRSDRLANVQRLCPAPNGDGICEQVTGAPFTTISPPVAAAAAGGDEDDGGSPVVFLVIAIGVLAAVVLAVTLRRRRKRADEPVEIEV